MVIKINPLLQRAKDIEKMVPYWDMVDAILEGSEAIREGREKFLPRFAGEPDDRYDIRLKFTKFTNIYSDVVGALSAKPFEDEIKLVDSEDGKKTPEEIKNFIQDVDGFGNTVTVFSSLTFFNGINAAIDWIFVDYPNLAGASNISVAEAKKMNARPFWTHVIAKNVLEVRTEVMGSKKVLSYIRIKEPSVSENEKDHIRVFERNLGIVSWTLYEVNMKADSIEAQVIQIENGFLSIDEIPFIPFCTGRRNGNGFTFYPPMKDAADLQITLYQEESDLQHIKKLACFPMLAANGMKPQMAADGKTPLDVSVGPMGILYGLPKADGGNGEWKILEPNANSMEFLKKDIDKTKQDLRELGRQPLTSLSTQLTTVTTSIAAGKAKSAVTAWAIALKDTLENALVITCKYMNIKDYNPSLYVYTGFDNVKDDGSDLNALLTAHKEGVISSETLCEEFKRRKVLSPEFNIERENERILKEVPIDPNQSDDNDANIGI